MQKAYTILYIHGMGGGGDSRIPSILRQYFGGNGIPAAFSIDVICRTYSFDPEVASDQIQGWMSELQPDMVIGESLGALHALRLRNIPVILISPALNAPFYFELLSWMTLIPGITPLFDRIYRPKEGDRQPLHFTHSVLRKYLSHRKKALENLPEMRRSIHAFFGTSDHYRRSGVVSIKSWKKRYGNTYTLYDGSHYTEEEHIYSLLIPKILDILVYNK